MQDCVAYYGDDQFTTITWYGSSPYYIPECGTRQTFYGVSGIPHSFFDGYEDVLGGASSGSMFSTFSPIVSSHLSDPSPLSMTAIYRWESATAGTLFVHIDVTDNVTTTNNITHFMIVEAGLLTDFTNLARATLGNETFTLTTPGQSIDYEKRFTLDPSWNVDNIAFIAWVQTHSGNKEILQARKARLGQGILVSPEDGLRASGPVGGPFTPSSKVYTIENIGPTPVDYSVTKTEPWVEVLNASGTLAAYSSTDVTVQLSEELTPLLGNGYHLATVSFENTTNHVGDESRNASIEVGERSLVYSWDMSTNPYWGTQPQWSWGVPQGLGGEVGYPDPTSGHTGDNVFGYNRAGDYSNSLAEKYLTTAAFDCEGMGGVQLRFWRWLGVEGPSADHAWVGAANDYINFTKVWENPTEITDSEWVQVIYDISAIADNQSTVSLRWCMGTTNGSNRYCGWNIDDVEIWAFSGATSGVEDEAVAERPALLTNSPNPFNPKTTIAYTLPEAGHVTLSVYDVAGRLVRTLDDAEREAGPHSVVWDGTDDGGLGVGSGVYFCRLESDEILETRSMVLLK
jgi:hypothetical protein